MPEETLFESERRMDRGEIATYLRTVADKLDAGEPITLSAGEQNVTLSPPARPTFEVKAERETSGGEPVERSVEFELEWTDGEGEGEDEEGALSIE